MIEKKAWPETFEQIMRGGKIDIRLADFELKEGDEVLFKEWDPEKNDYTGKEVKARVSNIRKIDLSKYYDLEKIKEFGVIAFEISKI